MSLYIVSLHLPAYALSTLCLSVFSSIFPTHNFWHMYYHFFFQISSFKSFPSYSVILNLCPYLSCSNCCPSTHPLYFNHSIFSSTPLSIISPFFFLPCVFSQPLLQLFLSLPLCSMQLVLFGKSSGVRWCHVWRMKAATC